MFFYRIVKSSKFEIFITCILLLSTTQQIIDTYFKANDEYNFISDQFDLAISLIYITEMTMKVIALGFVMNAGTYLRDNWNKLDFFVMIVTIIDVGNKIAFLVNEEKLNGLEFFNILKLLRNLRTFRILSKTDQMKKIIGSLIDSLSAIVKILGIVFIVLIMMSIIGINLFYDQYNTCYVPDREYPLPILNFTSYLKVANISIKDTETVSQYVSLIIIF